VQHILHAVENLNSTQKRCSVASLPKSCEFIVTTKLNTICKCATNPVTLKRSAKISLFVGTVIGLINYGDHLVSGTITQTEWLKILLTYLVPFCVATYAEGCAVFEIEGR